MKILVTGGCGFIGSHLVRMLLDAGHAVVNLDKLTYAGNPRNLEDCASRSGYVFVKGDIADREAVLPLIDDAEMVINVAAETHVDRSLDDAGAFMNTNLLGVHTLCEALKEVGGKKRLLQVSTDEVYGSIESGAYKEEDRFAPTSPYSSAKAGGELLAFSYRHAYGLDVVATRGANTYGPNQYPEKLIPFFVTELLEGRKVPLYGDGLNVRDWLYVEDHARAIMEVAMNGEAGTAYNVPGENERRNIEVTSEVLRLMGRDESWIERVKDRPGHDRRYAVDGSRLRALVDINRTRFDEGIRLTVEWYMANESWWRPLKEASKDFFARHYGKLKKV